MNKMIPSKEFANSVENGLPEDGKSDSYNYAIADLSDIIDTDNRERLLPVLDFFIRSQANLHFAEYFGNPQKLGKRIEEQAHTFRGFIVYSKDRLPIAYAIYYPMIDAEGRRAAYCEDAYVVENFRSHGVMHIVFRELAKRILDEGCEYLQWTTDKRNGPFHNFAEKIGARRQDMTTLVGDQLLQISALSNNMLKQGWSEGNFETVKIEPKHIDLIKSLKINPNIIRATGDMPFKGFITFKTGSRMPVAVTPGWEHLSTFRVNPGIYLEHPTFAPDLSKSDKAQIILSITKPAQSLIGSGENMEYLRWHINKSDTDLINILHDELKMPIDCMIEPNAIESEMIPYKLTNGELVTLKNQAEANIDQVLKIPRGAPIGPAFRQPS